MKKKILMLCMGCFLVSLTAKAQWVVSDPGNLAQGIINAAKNIRDKHLLSPHAWGAGRLPTAHMDEDSKPCVQATGLAPVVS